VVRQQKALAVTSYIMSTVDTDSWWLKRLAPGTMLSLKSLPTLGFWLVYNIEVSRFPGNWRRIIIDLVDPRQRLTRVDIESSAFDDRWQVI